MTNNQNSTYHTPPYLTIGDTVAITCPAKKLTRDILDAVTLLESWGLNVVLGETVKASWHQFAGTDELRASDMQQFLDDPNIKAIFAARGGYGTIRIIDRIDFSVFKKHPKWIIGFSDITVLHSHIQAVYKTESIHGQMPLTIPDGSSVSLETLRKALFNEALDYNYTSAVKNRSGEANAVLIGGNLTLLVMMAGSVSEQDYSEKILFLEDVGEYLYNIDRMLYQLKRSGKLDHLAGLVLGKFSDTKDTETPFGKTVDEIIHDLVKEYRFPICYDFPVSHETENYALKTGAVYELTVTDKKVRLKEQ